jgi:hypothetical protein
MTEMMDIKIQIRLEKGPGEMVYYSLTYYTDQRGTMAVLRSNKIIANNEVIQKIIEDSVVTKGGTA